MVRGGEHRRIEHRAHAVTMLWPRSTMTLGAMVLILRFMLIADFMEQLELRIPADRPAGRMKSPMSRPGSCPTPRAM
jgi:hypothetical protein